MATLPTIQAEIDNEKALIASTDVIKVAVGKPDPFSERNLSANTDIALAMGIPLSSIENTNESGLPISSPAAAMAAMQDVSVQDQVDAAYEEGKTPEEAATVVSERLSKESDMSVQEFVLMQGLALADQTINPANARTMTNMAIWDRLIGEAIDKNEQGLFSKFLTFLDINVLRQLPIGAIEDITMRSNREGETIKEAFLNKSPDEFLKWATVYIEDRSKEGVFSSDSIWNLYKIANDARYLGNDPAAAAFAAIGVTDLIPVAEVAGAVGRGSVKSVTSIRRGIDALAVLRDAEESALALGQKIRREGVQVDRVEAGRSLPQHLDPVKGPVERPNLAVISAETRSSGLFEDLESLNKRGSLGEYLPEATIKRLADDAAEAVSKRVKDTVVKFTQLVDEGSNDYRIVVQLGADGGKPFPNKTAAQRAIGSEPSLVPIKNPNGRGWLLQGEKRLDVLGEGDIGEIVNKDLFAGKTGFGQTANYISDVVNRVFEPVTIRLGDRLGAKFMQAEAGRTLIAEAVKPYQKVVRSVGSKDLNKLGKYFERLRDGDLAHLRSAPDEITFRAHWAAANGAAPSDKVVKAYHAILDINNATWNIKASDRLKRVVAEGGELVEIRDGYTDIGYRVTNVPTDDLVFDVAANRVVSSDSLDDLIVYKVVDPYEGFQYITNVKRVRALNKSDVMPYNIGGPRTNAQFRWFVGTVFEQTLESGRKVNSTFKTLLGSFGQKQAQGAVTEINNITSHIKDLLTKQNVRKIEELVLTKEQRKFIDDLIRKNNNWDVNINDFDDLLKKAKDYGMNFSETFVFKQRDAKVLMEHTGVDGTISGMTYGELVGVRTNMRRGDQVLQEFGGGKAVNADPITSMLEQFSSEAFGYANRAATRDAIDGWVKLAEKSGLVDFKGIPKNDFIGRLTESKVVVGGTYDSLATQLKEQQRILIARLNQPTWSSKMWEDFTSRATEAIFQGTGFKLDLSKTDPASQLLKVGFYSKMGFFNPDQLILQAMHSSVILAASPRAGVKAMAYALPVQALASISDDATRALGLARVAKFMDVDPNELERIVRYVRESGRNTVDGNIIELQMPNGVSAASNLPGKARERAGQFLKASTIFFDAGEKVTRTMSMITAFLEHGVKRAGEDAFSPSGLRWIANREQDLTFRMTTTSKASWAQGPARVPTQWLSYSLNAMQALTIGRQFTAGEKLRMAAVLGPLWGMTGLGLGQYSSYIFEKLGFDPSKPEDIKAFHFIKYGLGDYILSEVLGGGEMGTAYSERVSVVNQPIDYVKGLFSENFITTVMGPSGEIAGDIWGGIVRVFSSAIGGREYKFGEDLNATLRNISTYDKWVKIRELIETGNYLSRTHRTAGGYTFEGEDKNMAVRSILFGATPAPIQDWYDYNEIMYKEEGDAKVIIDDLLTLARGAKLDMLSDDPDRVRLGAEKWREATDLLWATPLSDELKRATETRMINESQFPEIMRNAIKLGVARDAQIIETQRN